MRVPVLVSALSLALMGERGLSLTVCSCEMLSAELHLNMVLVVLTRGSYWLFVFEVCV